MIGLIGKKIGMTQLFKQDGERVPVTLIAVGPCPILQIKKHDSEGYTALQIGFNEKSEKRTNKPLKGHFKKSGAKPVAVIREIRLSSVDSYKEGQVLEVDQFHPGDLVDISGLTIGKGFQGGMKKWGWGGGRKTHGSMHHRAPGSIGASSFPSRVTKGHQMPGRMGGVQRTVQHLEVIKVDKEKHIMAVKGSIPGNGSSYLMVRNSKKIDTKHAKKTQAEQQDKTQEAKKGGQKKDEKAKKK
ncbi:MAG: 50S ribosomal protein L3 [Candidatus Omnitrophota bacterium]